MFRVSAPVISYLMSGIRKNPSLLSELMSKKHEEEATRAAIRAYIESLVDNLAFIDSSKEVKKTLD